MEMKVRIALFLISLSWLIVVFRMVRSRKIWERYAILWIYLGLAVLFAPFLVDVFDWAAGKIGVEHPPSLFFLLALLGTLLLLLQFSVEVTSLVRSSRDVVQSLAILEERVRRLESGESREPVAAASADSQEK